jgi:hypothetical protein
VGRFSWDEAKTLIPPDLPAWSVKHPPDSEELKRLEKILSVKSDKRMHAEIVRNVESRKAVSILPVTGFDFKDYVRLMAMFKAPA